MDIDPTEGMTKIEWTNETWNPVTGCDKVSQGCKNCYAEIMHRRLMGMFPDKYSKPFLGNIETHREDLFKPFTWNKPRMVFVNSMSDLFHTDVPDSFIDRVFAIMVLCPQHTFQILTKRPERMLDYFISYTDRILINRWADACQDIGIQDADLHLLQILDTTVPLKNVWLGTSCEDQKTADTRIPILLKVPAAIRFISCEPIIGFIDCLHLKFYEKNIHWVIAGGESGHHARPMHPQWARSLRDQCAAAGVPFFFKQWGAYIPYQRHHNDPGYWTSAQTGALFEQESTDFLESVKPEESIFYRKRRKEMSHNHLDGVQHLAFPNTQQLTHTSI